LALTVLHVPCSQVYESESDLGEKVLYLEKGDFKVTHPAPCTPNPEP
jgi:hypothetical protein